MQRFGFFFANVGGDLLAILHEPSAGSLWEDPARRQAPLARCQNADTFLKAHKRCKDGKRHVYYSLTESLRVSRQRVVQRRVLHLGELNTTQVERWQRSGGAEGSAVSGPGPDGGAQGRVGAASGR